MKNHNVIVYSTPSCPYCIYAKDYFRNNKIEFKDIDVSKDRASAQEMVNKSGQMGVPVIDIDGQILVGYQPDLFDKLLK
jgi:glutaredoxin 3